ncbi:hypothetical protein CDD80_157 [Ophiocordyceps camponoti-rufipedis]|uniref:Uncharacterized protein n=1 Tax=Ophiocordyceps camponoti-rufipedis TaxID=2004952 RepID=A0A2C5XQ61_9HYPO|nr:hypothetical protein CDD80_157 [Ophiocordyceps camponoti-rufipedis]
MVSVTKLAGHHVPDLTDFVGSLLRSNKTGHGEQATTSMKYRRQQLRYASRMFRKRRDPSKRPAAYRGGAVPFAPFRTGRERRRWARDTRNAGDSSADRPRPVRGASPLLAMAATAVATEELDRLSLMARRADAEATGIISLTLEPPPRSVSKGDEREVKTGS